jgi:hypothetical protein
MLIGLDVPFNECLKKVLSESTFSGRFKERTMNAKVFSQRFNKELTLLGFPGELDKKIKAVADTFGVTRYLANAMIFGDVLPPEEHLNNIARILEVCPKWLSGKTDKRKDSAHRELTEDACV